MSRLIMTRRCSLVSSIFFFLMALLTFTTGQLGFAQNVVSDPWQKNIPSKAAALKEEAKSLIEQRDYQGAIVKLKQSLALKQDYYLAVYNLALAYALRATDVQAPSEPDRKHAWSALYRAQAIAEAQGIRDAALYATLGWLASMEAIFSSPEEFSRRTEWYGAAQRFWESALKIDASSTSTLNNLGALYELRGDSKRALDYYAKAKTLKDAKGEANQRRLQRLAAVEESTIGGASTEKRQRIANLRVIEEQESSVGYYLPCFNIRPSGIEEDTEKFIDINTSVILKIHDSQYDFHDVLENIKLKIPGIDNQVIKETIVYLYCKRLNKANVREKITLINFLQKSLGIHVSGIAEVDFHFHTEDNQKPYLEHFALNIYASIRGQCNTRTEACPPREELRVRAINAAHMAGFKRIQKILESERWAEDLQLKFMHSESAHIIKINGRDLRSRTREYGDEICIETTWLPDSRGVPHNASSKHIYINERFIYIDSTYMIYNDLANEAIVDKLEHDMYKIHISSCPEDFR